MKIGIDIDDTTLKTVNSMIKYANEETEFIKTRWIKKIWRTRKFITRTSATLEIFRAERMLTRDIDIEGRK